MTRTFFLATTALALAAFPALAQDGAPENQPQPAPQVEPVDDPILENQTVPERPEITAETGEPEKTLPPEIPPVPTFPAEADNMIKVDPTMPEELREPDTPDVPELPETKDEDPTPETPE